VYGNTIQNAGQLAVAGSDPWRLAIFLLRLNFCSVVTGMSREEWFSRERDERELLLCFALYVEEHLTLV
jgi:hypothetical protein